MLLVLEAYIGTWAAARASWWNSLVIMGSAAFCSAAVCLATSALVLLRRCHISATDSLNAKASFANLGSYPTLVRAVQSGGGYWSIATILIGHSIATGSPFSNTGHPSSPHTIKSDGTATQSRLTDQAFIVQVKTKPSREFQVYSHATAAVGGCHRQFSCHKSRQRPNTNVLVPGQGK